MRKILKTLFILLFFNCFTHASSHTVCANTNTSCKTITVVENTEKDMVKLDNASTEVHPLFILDFPFK